MYSVITWNVALSRKPAAFGSFIWNNLTLFQIQNSFRRRRMRGEESETDNFQFAGLLSERKISNYIQEDVLYYEFYTVGTPALQYMFVLLPSNIRCRARTDTTQIILKRKDTKMSELHNIPLIYKAGVYSIADFSKNIDSDNAISLDYDAQYQMLTYDIPVGNDWRGMTLYNVPKDDLIRMLRAVYGKDGVLQNITAILGGHETLLYIRYENEEHARQEIRRFAIQNADAIIEQIRQCTDVVARLFIEYYCDSDNMDYHAVIGTADQMETIRQKGHYKDSCDYAGNYPSENLAGDNAMLIVMVRCAAGHPCENFRYSVEIMSKHIEEHALPAINKTEDFKYICAEYD